MDTEVRPKRTYELEKTGIEIRFERGVFTVIVWEK